LSLRVHGVHRIVSGAHTRSRHCSPSVVRFRRPLVPGVARSRQCRSFPASLRSSSVAHSRHPRPAWLVPDIARLASLVPGTAGSRHHSPSVARSARRSLQSVTSNLILGTTIDPNHAVSPGTVICGRWLSSLAESPYCRTADFHPSPRSDGQRAFCGTA
jgi:hypothetical protein